jgi:hypothetical protein
MGLVKLLRLQWDRLGGGLLMLGGGAALLLGWAGVSRAVFPAEQLAYIISGGLGGLFLLGAGATLWLSADLRDEWRHLDGMESRLLARVERLVDDRTIPDGPTAGTGTTPITEPAVVSA